MLCNLLVSLLSLTSLVSAADCRDFIKVTWQLDLIRHSVHRVAVAPKVAQICTSAPQAGNENATIEIRSAAGQLVFKQALYLSLQLHFDYIEGPQKDSMFPGETCGGVAAQQDTIVTALIPRSALAERGGTILFTARDGGAVLAKGRL